MLSNESCFIIESCYQGLFLLPSGATEEQICLETQKVKQKQDNQAIDALTKAKSLKESLIKKTLFFGARNR